jgi:hypothetical protein
MATLEAKEAIVCHYQLRSGDRPLTLVQITAKTLETEELRARLQSSQAYIDQIVSSLPTTELEDMTKGAECISPTDLALTHDVFLPCFEDGANTSGDTANDVYDTFKGFWETIGGDLF